MVNSADAALTTHHMKFTAHDDRVMSFGENTFDETDIDRRDDVERLGFDVISGKFSAATQSWTFYLSVARRGGLLHAKVHEVSDTQYVGRVTGGSGRFKGARGTVTLQNVQGVGRRVVVTYTLP